MQKNYQTRPAAPGEPAARHRRRPGSTPAALTQRAAIALPDTVTVAIAELAGELEEGLLAFVVGTGLKVLDVVLESEATALAGERGRHDPDRAAVRHGSDAGLVTLGGRQVPINRPRLRAPTARPRCNSRPTRWRRRPSCSDVRPWRGCWPSSPPGAIRSGSSPWVRRSAPRPARCPSRPCRAASSPPPSPPWPS